MFTSLSYFVWIVNSFIRLPRQHLKRHFVNDHIRFCKWIVKSVSSRSPSTKCPKLKLQKWSCQAVYTPHDSIVIFCKVWSREDSGYLLLQCVRFSSLGRSIWSRVQIWVPRSNIIFRSSPKEQREIHFAKQSWVSRVSRFRGPLSLQKNKIIM